MQPAHSLFRQLDKALRMKLNPYCAAAALVAATSSAQAGEIYGAIGLPGVIVGYAQPVGGSFALRADVSTLGRRNVDGTEEGIEYKGKAKANRLGLFADWFVAGGFRFTGGATFNDVRADLVAQGDGNPITIGGNQYPTSSEDRLDVTIKYPGTTPYLGIGWGHHAAESGVGFVFDLGASIGKAKLSSRTQGPNLSQVSQSDIDRELAELREGVGKAKVIPQISFGINYRF